MRSAARADYLGGGRWKLLDVTQTEFTPDGPRVESFASTQWQSSVNPEMIDVLIVDPERMSAWKLYKYTEHLAGNRQKTERYEIAMWKKLFYPLAVLVMMALGMRRRTDQLAKILIVTSIVLVSFGIWHVRMYGFN